MSNIKDNYKILGLSKDATEAEVKKALRILVKKYHPDENNSPEAEEKIREILKAYNEIMEYIKKGSNTSANFTANDESSSNSYMNESYNESTTNNTYFFFFDQEFYDYVGDDFYYDFYLIFKHTFSCFNYSFDSNLNYSGDDVFNRIHHFQFINNAKPSNPKNNQEVIKKYRDYIKEHYDEIPKRNSNGMYTHYNKLHHAEPIPYNNLEFIDGYAMIPTYISGGIGYAQNEYIDENGNFCFTDMKNYTYLGKGIFIKRNCYSCEEGIFYTLEIFSDKGAIKSVVIPSKLKFPIDDDHFIDVVVSELNRKTLMELSGEKYVMLKKKRKEWIEYSDTSFYRVNVKPMVEFYVEEISKFEREMQNEYELLERKKENVLKRNRKIV